MEVRNMEVRNMVSWHGDEPGNSEVGPFRT